MSTITNAQYKKSTDDVVSCIKCEINGTVNYVPISKNNTDYAEILKQVKAGTLTIKDAD
jgi:hypothetical protein|tara:strand:+ start:2797 stop:2973 length:177 start_codon:yes stop_codon:yes gene_type:complete